MTKAEAEALQRTLHADQSKQHWLDKVNTCSRTAHPEERQAFLCSKTAPFSQAAERESRKKEKADQAAAAANAPQVRQHSPPVGRFCTYEPFFVRSRPGGATFNALVHPALTTRHPRARPLPSPLLLLLPPSPSQPPAELHNVKSQFLIGLD